MNLKMYLQNTLLYTFQHTHRTLNKQRPGHKDHNTDCLCMFRARYIGSSDITLPFFNLIFPKPQALSWPYTWNRCWLVFPRSIFPWFHHKHACSTITTCLFYPRSAAYVLQELRMLRFKMPRSLFPPSRENWKAQHKVVNWSCRDWQVQTTFILCIASFSSTV